MIRKFPFVKQRDSMQCGAACLLMICRYHGLQTSLEQLEKLCMPSKDGVSLLGLKESAQKIGFNSTAVRIPLEALDNIQLPCILHWNQNHFVVLYKIGKNGNKFVVADPGRGIVKYTLDEFRSQWVADIQDNQEKGIAMELIANS